MLLKWGRMVASLLGTIHAAYGREKTSMIYVLYMCTWPCLLMYSRLYVCSSISTLKNGHHYCSTLLNNRFKQLFNDKMINSALYIYIYSTRGAIITILLVFCNTIRFQLRWIGKRPRFFYTKGLNISQHDIITGYWKKREKENIGKILQ